MCTKIEIDVYSNDCLNENFESELERLLKMLRWVLKHSHRYLLLLRYVVGGFVHCSGGGHRGGSMPWTPRELGLPFTRGGSLC